jgi:drug/metabolite transporter (DMT)-like permease
VAVKRELVQPPAVQINSRRVIVVGTVLFAVGFVVLLPFYGWLGRHDHRVWLWTCLAGVLLGVLGYAIMRRHRGQGRTS